MKRIILLGMLISMLSANAFADGNVKTEIIERCKKQMGEYGASMVKACVDQDLDAVNGIDNFPDKYSNIVARCMKQMRQYGFSMVKACADQDIEAEEALSNY